MAEIRTPPQPLDGHTIAKGVAKDVARMMGERVVRILLYGSWARGEARPDSDVDILVVATQVLASDNRLGGPLRELAGKWLWSGGRPVSIRVVTQREIDEAEQARLPTPRDMFLRSAAAEGVSLDVAA